MLRDRGYRVAAVPTVATALAAAGDALDCALTDDRGWSWIVVTSAAGARAVGEALARMPATTARPAASWAAVGPATAAALVSIGIQVDVVPHDQTGIGLARELSAHAPLRGRRVLLPRSDAASPDLPHALRAAGAEVHEVAAYRTVEAPADSAHDVARALADPGLAAIVVASGSAVRGLLRLASEAGLTDRVLATPLVSIGPTTSAVARDLGLVTVVQAATPTVEALATAVAAVSPTPSPMLATARRTE
jgi:uroporphyrinogen-III synthase